VGGLGGCGLLVVDLLLVLFLEALQVLLLEVALDLRRGGQFASEFVVGVEVCCALVDFGDDLEVGRYLVLGGGVELVLDDAEQSFVELQQRIYLVLVRASHLLQLLQLLLA
jgi:hypothetical protein